MEGEAVVPDGVVIDRETQWRDVRKIRVICVSCSNMKCWVVGISFELRRSLHR